MAKAANTVIKAILYDLDGVLVDACDWHYEALNRALRDVAGFEIPVEQHVRHFNGLPTLVKLQKLMDAGRITREQASLVSPLKQKYVKEVIRELARPDQTKVHLHQTARSLGLMLGCVTNSIRETTYMMLDLTEQRKYMHLIITNEDVIYPKPDPNGYCLAMADMGVKPDETLIVEDSDKGIAAAQASGAHVLRVKNATEVHWRTIEERL